MARSPLFDYYDPYDLLTQQAQLGMLPEDDEEMDIYGAVPVRRKPRISDLMPEEQQKSMLSELASRGTSALAGLGYALDTSGSAVRGALVGKPASVFGSSEDRVDGRDLLRHYGLIGKEDTWANFAAGLAAEIFTDPLTYINPFASVGRTAAKSLAGRAAARAGLLDDVSVIARKAGMGPREWMTSKTVRDLVNYADDPAESVARAQRFANAAQGKGLNPNDLLDAPLAGVMEARLPTMESGYLLGTGATGQRIARAADRFGETLATNRFTAPVVNRFTRAFDPSVMERLDYEDQLRAQEAFYGAQKNERNFREEAAKAYHTARQVDPATGLKFDDQRIQNAIRDTIEANADPDQMARLLDQEAVGALESVPEWKQYRDWYAQKLKDTLEARKQLGLEAPIAESLYGTGFMPSQAVRFGVDRTADIPGRLSRRQRAYDRGAAVYSTSDLVGKSRNPYLDLERRSETIRRLMQGPAGAQLRDRLYGATPEQIPRIIDEAFAKLNLDDAGNLLPEQFRLEAPYSRVTDAEGNSIRLLEAELADPALEASARIAKEQALAKLRDKTSSLKLQLGDLLRGADRQFADSGLGLFDRHTMTDILRYGAGGARSEANARVLAKELEKLASDIPAGEMPGGGAVNLLQGAEKLGFNQGRLKDILQGALPGRDIDNLSLSEAALEQLRAVQRGSNAVDDSALSNLYDSYTNAFKVGVLANPAYQTRNLYSGYLATLLGGGGNPWTVARNAYAGWQAGRGNYGSLVSRLRNAPGYRGLSDQAIIDKFLVEAARNPLGQGLVAEGAGDVAAAAPNILPGMDTQDPLRLFGRGGILYDPQRTWRDWSTMRGVDFEGAFTGREAPRQTLNPLLQLHERASRRVEDANRLGAYITGLQQGMSPDAAADFVFKTQVDYAPRAYTATERAIKKWVPFYSYPRGILPMIGENLLQRPGGLQGQMIRAMNAGTRPSEENFTPEHLRATAAIPIPWSPGGENMQRYLANIDTPVEVLDNLAAVGTGNTFGEMLLDTAKRTGVKLAGQLNPVVKAPLEWLLNRQLYTGRELSDVYSALENDQIPYGRTLEQIIANSPFSKLNAIYRTARDERLTPADRALKLLINNTLGVKVTDIDKERTKRLAARDMLNQLLESTPGVRTYENITVPPEAFETMAPQQKDMYLLYKIIQSEAAKRAREKKKAEAALDPLELLGAVNRF